MYHKTQKVIALEVNNVEKVIVSSPDSGLPSSSSPGLKGGTKKARIAAALTPDNSPALGKKVPAENKNVSSVISTPRTKGSGGKILKGRYLLDFCYLTTSIPAKNLNCSGLQDNEKSHCFFLHPSTPFFLFITHLLHFLEPSDPENIPDLLNS